MRKALMIAYQFPPMGGSGVQRTTKFVKYLRHFGWEPVIFTREIKNMALKDESLLKDIPMDVRMVRTHPFDFTEWPGFMSLPGKVISRKLLIPDGERLWQVFSKKQAVETVIKEKIDLIYTTSYPYSDHLMGLYLKKKFPNIPWVADFRDEWTNNPYLLDNPHNKIRSNIEKSMEKAVIQGADYLITNTPVMLKNFINQYSFSKDKFHVIPNGYDEEDFWEMALSKPQNKKFTATYAGLLYGRRKPDMLFEAVSQLIKEDKIDPKKFHIKLIGNYKVEYINGLIDKYSLKDVVQVFPYMKHQECVKQLLGSDALLLIEGAGPGGEAFYTGKLFEYMNTCRPILAVIPGKGAAAQLIHETRTGYVSDCEDIQGTKENIAKLYSSWTDHKNDFSPEWDKIKRYERKVLTGELAEIFNHAMTQR